MGNLRNTNYHTTSAKSQEISQILPTPSHGLVLKTSYFDAKWPDICKYRFNPAICTDFSGIVSEETCHLAGETYHFNEKSDSDFGYISSHNDFHPTVSSRPRSGWRALTERPWPVKLMYYEWCIDRFWLRRTHAASNHIGQGRSVKVGGPIMIFSADVAE